MNTFNVAEESEQLQRLSSNAYTLTVRQAPERGKAFSGPKEKDRKPVDPPPIIQLQIRDPTDPASNYLQSPYFFMCCNLCDADLNRPGQLAAAQQGDDLENTSQSALAGTLVSSLHRLKDVDNSDGGFFVFPDVSVRLEGEFRLRFSLFEMLKTAAKVVYIKSVTSQPFTVYSPRLFPGMSESTFLSRSFGDQGVKIRVRKEPRVLGKRSAPSESTETSQPYPQQRPNYPNMEMQSAHGQPGGYGGASAYRDSAGSTQRPLLQQQPQQRDPYAQYPAREVPPPAALNRAQYFSDPAASRGSEFGHQRNDSSSAISPYTSPRNEYPTYNYPTQQQLYQQPQQYTYNQYSNTRQSSLMQQPVPLERQLPSSVPIQPGAMGSFDRSFSGQDPTQADMRYSASMQGGRPNFQQTQSFVPTQRTLPPPGAQTQATALPPLSSNYSAYAPSNPPGQGAGGVEGQGYDSYPYRGRGEG